MRYIVYLIPFAVSFFAAKRPLLYVGNDLAAFLLIVEFLQNIKKQVTVALGCPYKGHKAITTPDTSDCVWRSCEQGVKELGLYKFETR